MVEVMGRWRWVAGGGGREARGRRGEERWEWRKHGKFGESQTKAGEGERENGKQAENRGRDACGG